MSKKIRLEPQSAPERDPYSDRALGESSRPVSGSERTQDPAADRARTAPDQQPCSHSLPRVSSRCLKNRQASFEVRNAGVGILEYSQDAFGLPKRERPVSG